MRLSVGLECFPHRACRSACHVSCVPSLQVVSRPCCNALAGHGHRPHSCCPHSCSTVTLLQVARNPVSPLSAIGCPRRRPAAHCLPCRHARARVRCRSSTGSSESFRVLGLLRQSRQPSLPCAGSRAVIAPAVSTLWRLAHGPSVAPAISMWC